MNRWCRYYAKREPVSVFKLACGPRWFLAYTPAAVAEVQGLLRAKGALVAYRALCEDTLRLGQSADVVALPLDSPDWVSVGTRWRPLDENDAALTREATLVAHEELHRARRRRRFALDPDGGLP